MDTDFGHISLYSKALSTLSSYHEVGLTGKGYGTATGLSTTTQYYFKVDAVEYDITTGSDVTYRAVIALMNAQIPAKYNFSLVGGDLRCTETSSTPLALTAGSSGTDLFATLTGWSGFDTAVINIIKWSFQIPGRRAVLKQVRINFGSTYTGDIEVWIDKATGLLYDQKPYSEALSGQDDYFKTELDLMVQAGDIITISTDTACTGTSYIEIAYVWGGT